MALIRPDNQPPRSGKEMQKPILKLLLIEDNIPQAALIKQYLAQYPSVRFDVEHVRLLVEGLKRLVDGDIEVVLLDLSLHDSYGLDTLDRLQSQTLDVPVVILTNIDEEEVAMQAIIAGAQDYLIKSRLDALGLGRAVRFAIERQKLTNEMRLHYEEKLAARAG